MASCQHVPAPVCANAKVNQIRIDYLQGAFELPAHKMSAVAVVRCAAAYTQMHMQQLVFELLAPPFRQAQAESSL